MTKEEHYQEIIPQIQSLISGETDLIANMANIAAVLHSAFHFWWTGFYLVKEENDKSSIINHKFEIAKVLVLGPFQGPIACTRIPYNKGVCGTAWAQNKTLIVPNVHEFPGHIACDSASESEIVIPIHRDGKVAAVLDIDSPLKNRFGNEEADGLSTIVEFIEKKLLWN